MLEKIHEILHFWFGENKNNWLSQSHKWWQGTAALDEEIKTRFGSLHHLAVQGALQHWLEQPLSCLAYIILLDQFSRHIYRNTPLAFAQDTQAKAACYYGRERKWDKDLHLVQRQFFYMPLEHSEDLADQKLCLALMKCLVEEARENSTHYLTAMEQAYSYAQKHYDIISNFNRFPHRNQILNRDSTQEELVFLTLPGSSF